MLTWWVIVVGALELQTIQYVVKLVDEDPANFILLIQVVSQTQAGEVDEDPSDFPLSSKWAVLFF